MRRLAAGLLLAGLVVSPALAVFAPTVLLERSRVSHRLDSRLRLRVHRWVDALAVTAMPGDFQDRLRAAFPALSSSPAFQLYCGVALVERREAVVQAFAQRIGLLQRCQAALDEYLTKVNREIRRAPCGGKPGVVGPDQPFPPRLHRDKFGLHVLRELPWPALGMKRTRLRSYRTAAQADISAVGKRVQQARSARAAFEKQEVAWMRYLGRRASALEDVPESRLMTTPLGRESSSSRQ